MDRELGRTLGRHGLRVLMLVDLVGLLGVLVALNILRFGESTPATYPPWQYALAFLAASLVHLVIGYFGGLYERELRLGSRPQLPRVAGLAFMATLFVGVTELMLDRYYVPRLNLLALPVATALLLAATRRLARLRRLGAEGPPRALLVGAPDDVNLARAHLSERSGPAVVVGATASGADLIAKVDAAGATDVLLLSAHALDDIYPEPLTTLERRGIGVLQRIAARDTLLGLTGLREIAGMPFVALRTHALPLNRARFKRCLEMTGLVLAAPLLATLLGLVALYVRAVAGAPVLYRQLRVGRGGVPFTLLKFRTMRPGAEQGLGPVLAAAADARVIPACRWLRATRLDELPQLWNVVRGEMSVVGPRPERPELTAQYERLIPGYARRHEIPPGLTGLAQIHGRYHTDPEYKLGHDLQYLVNWSPVLDLQILARTLWVMATRRV
jgi:exopolysaccharide biosynthesis polyprenyl glycosylphosphotransferase